MARSAAYVTLLTRTSYLPGTLVLHKSLVDVGSKYPLVVMVTPAVTAEARAILTGRGITLADVESLVPSEGSHTLADHDARFQDTWTKLRYEILLLMCVLDLILLQGFRAYSIRGPSPYFAVHSESGSIELV